MTTYSEWTKEQFREKVIEIVRSEDKEIHESKSELQPECLDQFYVVIDTDDLVEFSTEMLREDLEQPLGPKLNKIDEVFVVGPYEGANNACISGKEFERIEKNERSHSPSSTVDG